MGTLSVQLNEFLDSLFSLKVKDKVVFLLMK